MALSIVRTSTDDQGMHDRVVDFVAASRFNIDGWTVTANAGADACCQADIVATSMGSVVAIGEVEADNSVSESIVARWKSLGASCPRFYLFVPEGTEEYVMDLLEKNRVVCAGVRCYARDGDSLIIRSVAFRSDSVSEDTHVWWTGLGKG